MKQNTNLTEIFDLPDMEDIINNEQPVVETEEEVKDVELDITLAMAKQAEKMLEIRNGDGHADASDVIHNDTLQHARDLMDLGYNVDQRSAATIFEKAAMLYKAALDAKNSKRDMQLKAMKLMLDSRKLDLEEKRLKFEMGEETPSIETQATVMKDRNELIKKFRDEN